MSKLLNIMDKISQSDLSPDEGSGEEYHPIEFDLTASSEEILSDGGETNASEGGNDASSTTLHECFLVFHVLTMVRGISK